jgi:hypothetical protein
VKGEERMPLGSFLLRVGRMCWLQIHHGRLKVTVTRGTALHAVDLLSPGLNPFVTAVLVGPPGHPRSQASTLPVMGGDHNPVWVGDAGVGTCG